MEIPPIVIYARQRLLRLVMPIILVYGIQTGLRMLAPQISTATPFWVWIIAYTISFPSALLISVLYWDWRNAHDARKLGAILLPVVYDKWPGGVSLLRTIVGKFNHGYIGEAGEMWTKMYGNTINTKILFTDRIFTTEPEHIKIALATQFDAFEKGPLLFQQLKSLFGAGVFNSDGDLWRFHRSMTRPFFSKERITHFEMFGRIADDAISRLKHRLREGYAVDIQDLTSRFTLDSATEFLCGKNLSSLSADLPYPYFAHTPADKKEHAANVSLRAFSQAQYEVSYRIRFGHEWPLAEPFRSRTRESMRIVRAFIDPIIADAVSRRRATLGSEAEDKELKEDDTLLDYLVKHTDDRTLLRDETLNILIAGRDTTASLITFAIYMLALHPVVFNRVREEILHRVGPSRLPTHEDFREMKYLRAVVNETLRLYPPVPMNGRTTRTEVLLPSQTGKSPFYIPSGTMFNYSVFLMQRRTDLWGPDALEFDPDRFLDERLQKYLIPNPFIFLPFNGGPRICLGQQFAYNESSFFLVRLLQSFSRIELALDAQPPQSLPPAAWAGSPGMKGKEKLRPKMHLTLYLQGGLWVRMEEDSHQG